MQIKEKKNQRTDKQIKIPSIYISNSMYIIEDTICLLYILL